MTDTKNPLGDYLRARRELVTPEQAGIVDRGGRRVPGLRREEVAMLAGISVEYYLRLERGRDRNPSEQVLDALARVLRLDDEHVSHLRGLVGAAPRRTSRRGRVEVVPESTRTLLATLPYPAFVEGRHFDVLAANPLATALSPRLVAGGNQLRDVFLDPAERALHLDHDGILHCYVSSLRQSVGPGTDDPRLVELVGELSIVSPRFRELWGRHDVGAQRNTATVFDHPEVGELTLHRERLVLSGTDGLALTIYHAEPGSADAEKLGLLASAALAPAQGTGAQRRSSASPPRG